MGVNLAKYKLAAPAKAAGTDLAKYKVAAPAPDNRDFLQKATDVIKKSPLGFTVPLGEALGNSLYGIGQLFKGKPDALMEAGAQNNKNYGKVVGSTVASAALPVSLAVGGGTGATALGRVGSAALKYGATSAVLGGGEALSQGQSVGDSLKAGAKTGTLGAVLGGATQGAGELANYLTRNLPGRLVRQALPKIEKGNDAYALKHTKLGPIKSLLEESDATVSGLGEQVQNVLTHSRYADDVGAGDFAIKKTLNAFPNSDYDAATVVNTVKRLVPAQAKLVDKVANGTATLIEKNKLRSAIDPIIKKVFTDAPDVSASKALAAEFANALRGEVQSYAPETQPIFSHLSKEINLRNALQATSKKLDSKSALGLYDIVAALGGFATGGPVGTGIAIGAEKALRSPAVGLAGAKAVSKVIPAANAGANAMRGLLAPATAAAISQNGQNTAQQPQSQSQQIMPQSLPKPTILPADKQAAVRKGVELGRRVDPTGAVGAVEKTSAKVFAKALANIHPDDIHAMELYITQARKGTKHITDGVFASAEKLAEKFGISMDKGLKGVANAFEDVLRGKIKVPDTVVQDRDLLGRFKGSK